MSTSYFATFVNAEYEGALANADAESIEEVMNGFMESHAESLLFGTESNYWMLAAVLDYFNECEAFPYLGSARGERLGGLTESVVLYVPSDEVASVLVACNSADPRKEKESFREKTLNWFKEVRPDWEIDNDDDFEDLMANVTGLLSALDTAEKNGLGLLVVV
ncbi:hypothetical protein [Variovorax paradoxus]|uniref:hypothetical protein n=1 Tax=Variovorax paradoxus TaxID=34073 RepID=UPI003D65580E